MKTLKEAMNDTIEMYEFISQLKNENDNLRKENAKLLSSKGSEPTCSIISETEMRMVKVLKKNFARADFNDWRFPSVANDSGIVPFNEFYKAITRDFIYSGHFEDFGLGDLKEFFKDEIREFYNNEVAKKKAEMEKVKTEKEKEE